MHGFWQALAAHVARGSPAGVVLVGEHTRGSPGTAGARMFVRPDGTQFGTVGGGIMELRLVEEACTALRSGSMFGPRVRVLRHRRRSMDRIGEGESGMICAGRQSNVELIVTPRDRETLAAIAALEARGTNGTVTVGPGGLGCDPRPPDLSLPAVSLTGDADWLYREQLLNRNRLAIIGGGHCSLALSRIARSLDWHVTVFDRRADVETFRNNVYAHVRIVVDDYRDAAALIDWPELTDVVVMTTDFKSDTRALLGCVGKPLRFVGAMGSPAKIRAIREALAVQGVGDDELARIHAPVGVPMRSNTPAEIAVSVAAQLLQRAADRD
jgi:xanthine dehydrogenase accessory factor